jgi:hypothetical protein
LIANLGLKKNIRFFKQAIEAEEESLRMQRDNMLDELTGGNTQSKLENMSQSVS